MVKTKKKLIRITTADISLNSLIKGQLKFLNQYYNVIGVAKDTGVLHEVAKREGVKVVNAPLERPISIIKDIKALWFLYKLFKNERPWCVHANTPKGSLLGMIAALLARVPNRIYTVTGLRYQATHGGLRLILKTMERITCLCATKVIPEGNGVKQILSNDNITKKTLSVINHGNINGKDTAYFSLEATNEILQHENQTTNVIADSLPFDGRQYIRKKLDYKKDDFVFILIARMIRDKGINELSEAMKRLIDVSPTLPKQPKLLLVGEQEIQSDGKITEKTQKFLNQSIYIYYAGHQTDVRPYILASDALVLPSYREGFPNAPMEAGAMNLPCIVTDISGCNEIIINNVNGIIIPSPIDNKGKIIKYNPNDKSSKGFSSPTAKALYKSMYKLITNPVKTKQMAANSRRLIKERYEQKDVWEAIRQMYTACDIKK